MIDDNDVVTEIVDEVNDLQNSKREVRALVRALGRVVETWREIRDDVRAYRATDKVVGLLPNSNPPAVGRAPVPALPPVLQDVMRRLSPEAGLTEKERRMLQAAVRRTLESFEEWRREQGTAA